MKNEKPKSEDQTLMDKLIGQALTETTEQFEARLLGFLQTAKCENCEADFDMELFTSGAPGAIIIQDVPEVSNGEQVETITGWVCAECSTKIAPASVQ